LLDLYEKHVVPYRQQGYNFKRTLTILLIKYSMRYVVLDVKLRHR